MEALMSFSASHVPAAAAIRHVRHLHAGSASQPAIIIGKDSGKADAVPASN
jgi:hypothetical protein